MDTYFVILEFHLQAGFEDAALIVEEADTVGISHVYIQKMSRWVRCSYGKRAGFVGAKIGIFLLSSMFFKTFLPFFA